MNLHGPFGNLARLQRAKSARVSSWDRTGGNMDCRSIPPRETLVLADLEGPAIIQHIWITISSQDPLFLRNLILRVHYDGQETPSVQSPIGDCFGCGFGKFRNFVSLPIQMSPQDGRALNCWFPMPFARRAIVSVQNDSDHPCGSFYYYIDYEKHEKFDAELGYFHAQWRRECLTDGNPQEAEDGLNATGKGNYVILDAAGRGHYVGVVLSVDARNPRWYGEGDDMIFIDGEKWPPSLHGTGTEDYFNTAWCPKQDYQAPFHGYTVLNEGPGWLGKTTLYRFHIADPVRFEKSIRVTIEHGHNNCFSNDYSSVAYWYQSLPTKPFEKIADERGRAPLAELDVWDLHGWKHGAKAGVALTNWKVIGPFANPVKGKKRKGLGIAYFDEAKVTGHETAVDKHGKETAWRRVRPEEMVREKFVDLFKIFPEEWAVAYAYAEFESAETKKVLLGIGSDDGAAVWLNGKEVLRVEATRACLGVTDFAPVRLKKGRNRLLVKVENALGGWAFVAELHPDAPEEKLRVPEIKRAEF